MSTLDFKDIHNSTQLEALKNEIKGNLFEYLVAAQLARIYKIEREFHASLDSELLHMMKEYESWLRQNARDLISKLPVLALQTAKSIHSRIDKEVTNITVVGKLKDQLIKKQLHGADIVLKVKDDLIPVSLKLVKSGANVTTKSAGAKSIFSKYFKKFDHIEFKQNTINSIVDNEFVNFASKLYERRGLDFSGRFDSVWTGTDLPGELEGEDKDDLYSMYQSIIKNYYVTFSELLESDREIFCKSILPLVGLGNEKLVQATCFYKSNTYDYVDSKVIGGLKIEDIEICEFNPNISSFNIRIGLDLLQIRIKPMNRFTNSSFKINCSMKYN